MKKLSNKLLLGLIVLAVVIIAVVVGAPNLYKGRFNPYEVVLEKPVFDYPFRTVAITPKCGSSWTPVFYATTLGETHPNNSRWQAVSADAAEASDFKGLLLDGCSFKVVRQEADFGVENIDCAVSSYGGSAGFSNFTCYSPVYSNTGFGKDALSNGMTLYFDQAKRIVYYSPMNNRSSGGKVNLTVFARN